MNHSRSVIPSLAHLGANARPQYLMTNHVIGTVRPLQWISLDDRTDPCRGQKIIGISAVGSHCNPQLPHMAKTHD